MPYLEAVAVNEVFVEETWKRVSAAGSYYSIGDGCSREVLRKVLFQSNLVLRGKSILIRFEDQGSYVEMHPVMFGPSAFADSREIMKEAIKRCKVLFPTKGLCAIIPQGMRGARRLARRVGMTEGEVLVRPLSGVPITCSVWR